MEAAESDEAFARAPVGRYFGCATWVAWCLTPSLGGATFIGRPSAEDMAQLVRLLMRGDDFYQTITPPWDCVVDGRYLTSAASEPYELFTQFLIDKVAETAHLLRRVVVLRPRGMLGALLTGAPSVMRLPSEWRVFDTLGEAMTWCDVPDGAPMVQRLDALLTDYVGRTPLLRALRQLLDGECDVTATEAARRLATSERSLQRDLKAAGTSFRSEQAAARVRRAEVLLVDTDHKIEAIAHTIGCSSVSHFTQLFRQATGTTPGEYRARRRLG